MSQTEPFKRIAILEPEKIIETIRRLNERIEERFPESGLSTICANLLLIANQAKARALEMSRPIIVLRLSVCLLLATIIVGVFGVLPELQLQSGGLDFINFAQGVEAVINDCIFVGAGIFFLLNWEMRIKRERALRVLHELRSLAHIIDMHQLTKDPERVMAGWSSTKASPAREMSAFQLGRYLDYCSEMLSLTGKLAALYAEHLRDGTVLSAVNEIEELTTSLSRKIWQKIMILHSQDLPQGKVSSRT